MKIIFYCFATLVLVITGPFETGAQLPLVSEAIKNIPREGRTMEDFVPKGWELLGKATGDLNGDKIPDAALTLDLPYDDAEKLKGRNDYKGAPDIVVVLWGRPGGRFKRFAVNGKLFPEDGDSRSAMSPTIKNGVLSLNDNWGDGTAMDVTYRFRYDPASNKLLLIGFDSEQYNRANNLGDATKSSENYLTGVEIRYEKGFGTGAFSETGRTHIPRSKIAFEDTSLLKKDFAWRPF